MASETHNADGHSGLPHVFVVQKQTLLERFGSRLGRAAACELLARGGHDVAAVVEAHEAHVHAREHVLAVLARRGLTSRLANLDELASLPNTFFCEDDLDSGLRPTTDLVISLGGDGTLLHASHYVGGVFRLLGVNSTPGRSQGYLCAATPENFDSVLGEALHCDRDFELVGRLRVEGGGTRRLPLALNDVLVCHRHPAATSRYLVAVEGLDGPAEEGEIHKSSGVWISGPAGSTAAVSTYGLPQLALDETAFLVAVRELYNPMQIPFRIVRRVLHGDRDSVRVVSRMQHGLVCIDGADVSMPLEFAQQVRISLPSSAALRLVTRRAHV